MKLKDILEILSNKINKPVSQSMLANSLEITRQTICNRIKNDSEITVSELKKIESFFNVKLFDTSISQTNEVLIDYYPDVFASCGKGTVIFSEEKEAIYLPKSIIQGYSNGKKYSMINAKGDSMTPYINDGDKLIIEHIDGEQVIDNKIYVFCYKYDIFVKRLSKNVDEIIVKSDNPAYNTKYIKNQEINDIIIIGKIVGIIRSI